MGTQSVSGTQQERGVSLLGWRVPGGMRIPQKFTSGSWPGCPARCWQQGQPAGVEEQQKHLPLSTAAVPTRGSGPPPASSSRPAFCLQAQRHAPAPRTRWSARFLKGPSAVITAWPKQPRHAIMARRPLRISLVCRGEGGGRSSASRTAACVDAAPCACLWTLGDAGIRVRRGSSCPHPHTPAASSSPRGSCPG